MTDQENDIEWKKYFYEGTNVLINNLNIKDHDDLKEKEATITFELLKYLEENPIKVNLDKNSLNKIHKFVFGDIYPFAGKYRKVNMQKEKGSFLFIKKPEDIEKNLDNLFTEINEKLVYCRNKKEFSDIIARLYTGLIHIHPYREGNGRTIREFIRAITKEKSKELGLGELELDWSANDKEELNEYIEVVHLFPYSISPLFLNALVPKEEEKKR